MKLTRILLLVALAALPLFAMTAPAQGAKKMEVAIQNEGVFLYGAYYDQDLAYRQLRTLGATHLRMNVLWFQAVVASQRNQRTKPANIQYDFSHLGRGGQPGAGLRHQGPVRARRRPAQLRLRKQEGRRTSATATSRTASCSRTSSARRSPTSRAG